jgi:fibronectin-binding autotransporter adhesin
VQALKVGEAEQGTLTVSDGGFVSSTTSTIGQAAGSQGTATVTGVGSTWCATGLEIGRSGTGTLTISAGGRVDVTSASPIYVGNTAATGNGTLTVTGAGSTFDATTGPAVLVIGRGGTGAMTISDGGTVNALTGTIGSLAGGVGTVLVTGAGSTFAASNLLSIGQSGTGTLTITDGGRVTAPNGTYLAEMGASQGRLNLRGSAGTGRGVLETSNVLAAAGLTHHVEFDGGILRLTANAANLFFGFDAGNVMFEAGGGTIDTQGFTVASLVGLQGAGGLTKLGSGTLTLTGTNTFLGGLTVNAGTVAFGTEANLGAVSGGITIDGGTLRDTSAGGTVVNHAITVGAGGATFAGLATVYRGVIGGTGGITVDAPGSIVLLEGANSYGGTTTVAQGRLATVGGAAIPDSSNVSVAGGAILEVRQSETIGALSGAGDVIAPTPYFQTTLTIGGGASGTFSGVIREEDSDALLNLVKTGTGTQTLSGVNTYRGTTTVGGGRLVVNGSIANSAVTVLSGATLAGSGTVGPTTIQSGATISPGNSIGTLSVNGNLVLAPGSLYRAEIAGDGRSDRIAVSGSATVGGSQFGVTALDPAMSYVSGQRYTVLTAAGGVSGTASVTSQSAFLDVTVRHETNQIDLVIKVKTSDPGPSPGGDPGPSPASPPAIFGTVAQTRNQVATTGALDTLPQAGGTLALYNSLLMLDAQAARAAFDSLSGEVHASARTALIEDSRFLRGAVNDRLRAAFGGVGAAPMVTMSYGFSADPAPSLTGPMPALSTERFAVWGQGYGAWGRTGGDGNAAKLTRRTGGFLIGADASVFDMLRIGVIAGYDRGRFDVKGRFSSGESDSYHLGLYGGGQWGALGLRAGASYTWHDIETSRVVTFTGFSDRLKGDYDAGTAQVFGEVGYRADLGRLALEPFAGLAYVNLHGGGPGHRFRRHQPRLCHARPACIGPLRPAGRGPDAPRRAGVAPRFRRCRSQDDAGLCRIECLHRSGRPDRPGCGPGRGWARSRAWTRCDPGPVLCRATRRRCPGPQLQGRARGQVLNRSDRPQDRGAPDVVKPRAAILKARGRDTRSGRPVRARPPVT